jgi:tRNA(His) guanylyltransferase
MSTDNTTIGKRMKENYEYTTRFFLPRRIPVIIRVDGRSFHTLTRKLFGKKWSEDFTNIMIEVSKKVSREIQGCDFCYCQSDEISFLLTDYKTINTECWFKYNISKIVSISAALATCEFAKHVDKDATFDSRAFSMPQDEVCNYFLWRQQDASRNSLAMSAQECYSHKQLYKKSTSDMNEMLFQKGINYNDFSTIRKRGFCIVNNELDKEIPIFSKDRNYVEQHVFVKED